MEGKLPFISPSHLQLPLNYGLPTVVQFLSVIILFPFFKTLAAVLNNTGISTETLPTKDRPGDSVPRQIGAGKSHTAVLPALVMQVSVAWPSST